jgi:ABC-type antimicrobial peptide transport system permease subunit
MRLLGIFAGIGVFLAAIGVYGVISYTVEHRAQEFGIRAAFGAEQNDILRIVLREGIVVLTTGLLLGAAGAFAATRLIAKKLFDIKPMDPATIAAVGIVLTVTALLACYIPAKRATKLDPLSVLRTE